MSDESEQVYSDGEVVWVKLGSCWWPGEVVCPEKLPPDLLPSFRKPPIAVVKFFQEDTYEYVKNTNLIYKYNCSRKTEFIKKGLDTYRTKHGHMEKFPEDVIRAETATGGDIEILTRDEFQEMKKESYAGLFGTPAQKTPISPKKGKGKRGRPSSSSKNSLNRKINFEKSDYKVHILVQSPKLGPTQSSEKLSTPSTSCTDSEAVEEKTKNEDKSAKPVIAISTPTLASGVYSCHACPFTTIRLNVMILHNKTHSATFTPYTPSPVRKKLLKESIKSTPNTSKPQKVRRPRSEKVDESPKKNLKRGTEESFSPQVKKIKTDEEIKSSLLADWDDFDEELNDESSTVVAEDSPSGLLDSESPAMSTQKVLLNVQVPNEPQEETIESHSKIQTTERQEPPNDSKYEFCEDEDWHVEADAGRKIPRVKNSSKPKDDRKSLNLDENDVAREVAELLSKTTVPDLPSAPEPLKIEANFPEPPIVKSPDKKSDSSTDQVLPEILVSETQSSKPTIFKTKTFFRSRHSRSQDAIGKYVAEQLNAAERMDISESEINGTEVVSSPEARESPPVEQVKVARLAPKIQLKKMKAEALQLKEKVFTGEPVIIGTPVSTDNLSIYSENDSVSSQSEKNDDLHPTSVSQDIKMSKDILYNPKDLNDVPNKETPETISNKEKISEVPTKNESNEISNQELFNQIGKEESYEISSEKESRQISTEEESIEISKNEQSNEVYTTKDIAMDSMNEDVISEESTKNIVQLDLALPENLNNSTVEQMVNKKDVPEPILKFPEPGLPTPCNDTVEPYMNESTASAVDALLSVSRKTDRVTKVVSDDPPEDLFDDDNETSTNGYNENLTKVNEVIEELKNYDINSMENMNKTDLTEIKSAVERKTPNEEVFLETISKSKPSESDLQIAQTLLNLPSTPIQNTIPNELPLLKLPATAIQNKIPSELQEKVHLESCQKIQKEEFVDTPMTIQDISVEEEDKRQSIETKLTVEPTIQTVTPNQNLNVRFETEQEKSENLNAAQSLVQMSESVDHSINVVEPNSSSIKSDLFTDKPNNGIESIEEKLSLITNESITKLTVDTQETKQYESSSPKLLKILEEPCVPKVSNKKSTPTKQLIVSGREKILNFDVNTSTLKSKSPPPKQKIIIRRTPPNKTLNSFADAPTPDKIILSRDDKLNKDGSSVQTYTIKTTSEVTDPKTIVIQPKIRKIKSSPKLQKVKQHPTLVPALTESRIVKAAPLTEDSMFDINSMPIVLSDDILTPENIEKMPIVMSDGNIITNPSKAQRLKTKAATDEKTSANLSNKPEIKSSHKPEMKTLLMNPVSESIKVTTPTTPNILSKSSKLRGAKPMLVIDKTTGKQKIIMTKSDTTVKEINITQTKIQPIPQNTNKTDKFIILPSASSPRPQGGRTQKIVIDPQAGKAHVIVAKNADSPMKTTENKSVSAKFIPAVSDVANPTNTVMIITNAQGAQSRIVLTPEHEKILFPNKHQGNVSQIKTITQRVTSQPGVVQKTVFTTVPSNKTNTKIVPKQPKSAIITSKGQLIVGGRVTATGQNMAQMPEIRPAPKRIVATEPKKIIQTIQKATSEPLILLQQKSGSVMQLTAAQFEHLQRTGQIVQKSPAPVQENKIIMKKTIAVPAKELVPPIQKPRIRKLVTEAPMPAKKLKHEIVLAPAPPPLPINAPIPALTPLSNAAVTSLVPSVSNNVPVCTTSSYPEFENFEELLPSTAIVRQNEPPVAPLPEPAAAAPPASLSDGQLLAVPGEHFGGPHGSFYLCVKDSGTLTPIDNRPLVLENNQLVPMAIEPAPVLLPPPERRDILEAALANSDVFHADSPRDEAPDFRDLNANVSVHCRVSETSTTLNQPIMTPVEVPTKVDGEPTVHSNLEDGLAVIGVTPPTVPTSLELPITVTDPRIAPKTTDPLSGTNYGATLLTSPCVDMSFAATEEAEMVAVGPISMPLLTEEDSVGKSMPLLTDDVITERTVSSVESAVGSPSSAEVRESEAEEGGGGGGGGAQWARRLLTPTSDTSETSAEIPLQPHIQLSVNDFTRHS